ncbi:MAG: tetratricopeptide repeat protein [Burkholderiales bacterium]
MLSSQESLQDCLAAGLRAHRQGDVETAAAAYRRALAIAPDDADALNLMGAACLELGQPGPALDCLRRAARQRRNDPGVLGNLAQAHFALGHYGEAGEAFRKASRLAPHAVQFQIGVATALAMQRKLDAAETLLRRLTSRFPDEALVWFNLGNVLRDLARFAEALDCYRAALARDPQLVEARNNLGGALQALQRFEEAEREYRACLAMAPDYALAKCNLASVIIDLGRFGEAEALCREVIREAPGLSEAHTFLGAALGHQGRQAEALACHRTAAQIAPRNPRVVETYASALVENGAIGEGLRWFSRALALDPESLPAHQLLASALLAHGYLADGWAEYRHRPAFIEYSKLYAGFALSRTLPCALGGKRVCLLREQGLGDELFFLRFVPQLTATGARVTYRAGDKIRSLLERAACFEQVLEKNAPLPPAEVVMLLGDLPHALGAPEACALLPPPVSENAMPWRDFPRHTAVFWPAPPPSLVLPPLADRLAAVRRRLAAAGNPPYVGVTWKAGTAPQEQRDAASWRLHKEIAIPALAGALRDFPATFLALQRHPAAGQIEALARALGQPVHDFTDLNEDLEGMLALLALIDEYVGVSNTNMHLRAAAGRTAHVLVPCPGEWRWLASGSSSPWFPDFRIYRQALDGSWDGALAKLRAYFVDGIR